MSHTLHVLLTSAACCLLTTSLVHAAKPVGEPFVYKTVAETKLTLYVTKPTDWQATDRRPAIVFFHGGAWIGGAPGQYTEHSKYLASRGMVSVQVEYRLLSPTDQTPPIACIHDARSAMRWVRGNAAKLGVDSSRIASAGGSAGGHLAAFVGMVDGMDDPQDDTSVSAKSNAMVLFNPVFDNGPDGGWGYERVGERFEEFSPAHNITEDDPPAIVFFGSQDALVPVSTAERFQRRMRQAGVHCELMMFDGKPHGFFNYGKYDNRPYRETVVAMDKFLVELGWLQGPPTLEQVP